MITRILKGKGWSGPLKLALRGFATCKISQNEFRRLVSLQRAISQPTCEILQIANPRKPFQLVNSVQINAFQLNLDWHGLCNGGVSMPVLHLENSLVV